MTDFTMFRLLDTIDTAAEFVEVSGRNVQSTDPTVGRNFFATVFVDRTFRLQPTWADFIEQGFPGAIAWQPSYGIGALIVIQVEDNDRWKNFALAFGPTGRRLLRDDTYARRWGLKAALNLISDPNASPRLRAFDTTRHGQNILRSRLQATVAAGLEVFEIDVLRDLVRSAVGRPAETQWGGRVGGSDALQITHATRFEDIGDFCLDVDEIARRTTYRQRFRWVDYVSPVSSQSLIGSLQERILEVFVSDNAEESLSLAPPEVVDWDHLASFQFHFDTRQDVRHPDVSLGDYLRGLRRSDPDLASVTIERLKSRHLIGLDGNGGTYREWSIWRCLVSEFEYEGETFILEDGTFYTVDTDFLASLNRDILRFANNEPQLPSARLEEHEGPYNDRVAMEDTDYLCMDRKLVRFEGNTDGVELCDLLTKRKQFIHVKSYSSSATLSHLFSQARTSADLLQVNGDFRVAAQRVVNRESDDNPDYNVIRTGGVAPDELEIVVAIMKRWGNDTFTALPFFAKLNLRNVATELDRRGFHVKVARIHRRAH